MGVEDVFEKTHIEFPRPLPFKEVDNLLAHIAKDVSGHVVYSQTHKYNINKFTEDGKPGDDYSSKMMGVDVEGSLYSLENAVMICFTFETSHSDEFLFWALRISSIPGYKVDEHSKEEVRMWDAVRASIKKYFFD